MKVKDLKEQLKNYSDETEVVVKYVEDEYYERVLKISAISRKTRKIQNKENFSKLDEKEYIVLRCVDENSI